MGGAVSSGEDNADLVEKLMEGDYIKDPLVEKVFRAVDRGDYFLSDQRMHAYKDQAWKHGNVHLSAPCIYAEVMEWLKLGPGMSFLNLGSGTGYLSTMAGLILGPYGVNHGVEYYQDVIDYAEEKLDLFIRTNEAFDEFEFCEPTFVQGNCLLLSPSDRLYDRLYCGAACPSENENYIKKLIKIGGILVMPLNDQLIQVTRVSETQWDTKMILPVSFARLIPPHSAQTESEYRAEDDGTGEGEGERVRLRWKNETASPPTHLIELPSPKIMTLQEISRLNIRRILLQNIHTEHPNVSRKRPRKSKKRRQPPTKQRRVNFVPTQTGLMFVGQLSDDSDREPEQPERRRMRGRNVRENPWSRFGNALITQLFNPYLVFLPGEERDHGEEGGVDGLATSEERNVDADNGLVEDASLREMEDEPMLDAEAGNSESSSESSGDEKDFLKGDRFRLRGAPAEMTLRVNSDVIAAHERGNINDTSLDEEAVVMPNISVATTPTVPVVTASIATAQMATADIATSTTTAHLATASTAAADVAATGLATTPVATLSLVTADTTTISTATADAAKTSTAMSAPEKKSNFSAASYSSGVETCSSVDADSVETDAPSSIYWTREFQTGKVETESEAPHGKESETDCTRSRDPEASASHVRLSPTPGMDRCVLDDLFGREGSSCDSTERTIGNDAEEEEESMEAETLEVGPTYRTYLQKKVDQLPIPQPMKQFLLFYRI